MTEKLKIEYLNKSELKPYANNAKIHTGEQIDQIRASIKDYGFNDPIAIWGDNEIVEGHGRLLAVMEMDDITEVPVVRLDRLTDEKRRAYMLVHNQLTMNTGFDAELLEMELSEIDLNGIDYGFDIQTEDEPAPERVDLSDEIEETFQVIVECANEAEQEEVYNQLTEEGYECRVLTL